MRTTILTTFLLALATIFAVGCSQSTPPQPQAEKHADAHDDHGEHAAAAGKSGHDHSGWWCDEHGIPEDVCSMCSAKVAADFQKKGDWCKEHDRADSQCFKCHPELEAKFAAQYEAKYGKKPPTPED